MENRRLPDDPLPTTTPTTDPGDVFSDPYWVNVWTNQPYYQALRQSGMIGGMSGAGVPMGSGGAANTANRPVVAGAGIEPTPTAGLPGMGGAGAAGAGIGSKVLDALPLLGGVLFGNKGPFSGGQMSGLSAMEPELLKILKLMRQRMETQGPLFSAANQGAYNLLPNSAKQGGMFSLPSSTGGR